MSSFLSRLQSRLGHLSDDTLAALVSGELSTLRSVRVNRHLNSCWQCRARRDALENAAQMVVHYRAGNLASCLPLDGQVRQSFLRKVDQALAQQTTVSLLSRSGRRLRGLFLSMNPVFASVVVLSLAGVLLFWIWQRSATTVSASELLRRAAASELELEHRRPSEVLYQQVSIQTNRGSFRHAIYRDLSGHRKARPARMSPAENDAEEQLRAAGINWDAPLSAADYKQWHDGQERPRDVVQRSNGTELTLTTTLDQGSIAEETLTVREQDFRPIRRTVEMRNEETIEVAELDYAVLGWNGINPGLFEPLAPSLAAASSQPALHAILPPTLPTPMQIDMAELDARALLSHPDSDSSDQIRVTHTDAGVLIKGIVETNLRKRELMAELSHVPYVRSEILSIEEMREHPLTASSSSKFSPAPSLEVYNANNQMAPLATFFEAQKISRERLSTTSKLLFDASAQMQTAASHLADLEKRFPSISTMPQPSQERYGALAQSYLAAIREGLKSERAALGDVGLDAQKRQMAVDSGNSALDELIGQNQGYCQELIAASASRPRDAADIAADIERTTARIERAINAVQAVSPQP